MIRIEHYNILLADDEYLLRQSVTRLISSLDDAFIVTHEASNGEEALEILKKENIHIVIADINMPVMGGLELARRIRDQYPDIATVLLTGFAEFTYAQEAIRLGVVDYLLKPVSGDDLSAVFYKIRLKLNQKYSLIGDEGLTGRGAREQVDYAVSYMQEHFTEDIDIGALSGSMGFTSAYLTKLFSRYVGETPLKFLTGIRMHEARKLLAETSLTIKEVGEHVGYPDQFSFSKTFRKYTDMNPTQYRKMFET